MATSTMCCVCNKVSPGMIQIMNHPNQLDTLLSFISGHQAIETDFLCIVCYEELKQACDFKRKCVESKIFRTEIPPEIEDDPVKVEPVEDKISECDSSIISMSEFLGSNGYSHIIPDDEEVKEEEEPEIEEIVIEDSSEDENETTQPSSPSKSQSPKKKKTTNNDENVDLFFSTSDKLCEYCFKTFDSKHLTEVHKKIHKFETSPYSCPYKSCKKKFQKRHYLQSHYIAHLTNYKCSFCEKTYKSKILMENHEKSHQVTIDSASESSSSSSKKTSKKGKYECKICGRRFGAKANLVFHAKYQHDKNWSSKTFECILCDEVFVQSEKLATHLKKVHKCS